MHITHNITTKLHTYDVIIFTHTIYFRNNLLKLFFSHKHPRVLVNLDKVNDLVMKLGQLIIILCTYKQNIGLKVA